MSGRGYLLDTNIIIALFSNNLSVVEKIKQNLDRIFIPSIALGELFFGAADSAKAIENLNKIDAFARASKVIDCNLDTASNYGLIKAQLKSDGRPIPENDIWIAAITAQHGFILVTQDKHFEYIDELTIEKWLPNN